MNITIDNKLVIIDEEDAHLLSRANWRVCKYNNTDYVTALINGRRTYLHRLISKAEPGQFTDHKDGDGLNNRKSNLRLVTKQQNGRNQKPQKRVKTSKYKGVSLHTTRYKDRVYSSWAAYINVDGKKKNLGLHETEESAAQAYDRAASFYFGEHALTNEQHFSEVA